MFSVDPSRVAYQQLKLQRLHLSRYHASWPAPCDCGSIAVAGYRVRLSAWLSLRSMDMLQPSKVMVVVQGSPAAITRHPSAPGITSQAHPTRVLQAALSIWVLHTTALQSWQGSSSPQPPNLNKFSKPPMSSVQLHPPCPARCVTTRPAIATPRKSHAGSIHTVTTKSRADDATPLTRCACGGHTRSNTLPQAEVSVATSPERFHRSSTRAHLATAPH